MRLIAIAALLAIVAPPAAAADKQMVDPKTGEKLICKQIEVTGSRARQERVCMTQAEWDKQTKESQNAVRGSQVMGSTNGK